MFYAEKTKNEPLTSFTSFISLVSLKTISAGLSLENLRNTGQREHGIFGYSQKKHPNTAVLCVLQQEDVESGVLQDILTGDNWKGQNVI